MRSTEGTKLLAGEVIVPLKIEFVEGSELPLAELIRKFVREELDASVTKTEPEVISPIGSLKSLGLTAGQIVSSVTHVGETFSPLQVDKKEPKRVNDLRPVVKQILHVLVEHKVPMSSLERVLGMVNDAAYTSTPVQEIWANDDYAGYKDL